MPNKQPQIQGMLLILDRRNRRGLKHWGDEVEKRGIPAVIQVDDFMIDENGELIRELANKGFEICGANNERPFWNEPYDSQHAEISRIKDKLQKCIDRTMRLFSSKYFAYNEFTLQITDKLDIEYIFARGVTGASSFTYKAEEYNTKILSVSNILSPEIDSGSL